MKASIIIPTANDDLRLRWTLEGLLQQTEQAVEVIVVNDGGGNSTQQVVESYATRLDIRYFYLGGLKRDMRAGATRNEGTRHSRSNCLIFMDGDVVADSRVVELLVAHHKRGVVHACWRRRLAQERVEALELPLTPSRHEVLIQQSVLDAEYRLNRPGAIMPLLCSFCMSAHFEDFAAIGGFDESFVGWGGEDVFFGYCALAAGIELRDLGPEGCVLTHLDHPKRSPHAPTSTQKLFGYYQTGIHKRVPRNQKRLERTGA